MSPKSKKTRLVIFDGNSIIHRAYHALPPTITTREGKPANAAFGFTSILLKALADLKPDYVVVAWDYPAATFRHKKYAEYKATRQKTDAELHEQVPVVKQIVETMSIPLLERKNYEADDILGTISKQAQDFKDLETVLVTGDLDALQLVGDRVNVLAMRKGISDVVTYDRAAVNERYGIKPEQLIDYKALRGDPSDNIPGVEGIGEKTALRLIAHFGTLEELYKKIEQVNAKGEAELISGDVKISGKLFERLIDHKDDAELSKMLATIDRNVPVKLNLKTARLADYDQQKVVELFAKLQFNSLVKRLPHAMPKETQSLLGPVLARTVKKDGYQKNDKYQLVADAIALKELINKLNKTKAFAVDTETTVLGPVGCELVGLSFSFKDGEAYYVPVGHKPELGDQCVLDNALKLLKPVLENQKIGKYGHNIKYDVVVLKNYGINLAPISFDSMIASYLLDPGRRQNSLDALAFNEFSHEMIPIEECIGVGRKQCSFAEVDIEKATQYAAEDADYTWRLQKSLEKKLKKLPNAWKIFTELELPLIPVLADMESRGIKIDSALLGELSIKYGKRVLEIKKKIYKHAKGEFNISSPKQLQEILFDRLGISTVDIKKTKTGHSTAASELEKLRGTHPVIDLISEYRELTKLISTYLDALPELVEPGTGRVHTSYNQTIAATGRLSSSDPNLQNIPVRTNVGNEIRKAFVAEEGKKLVALDYSQIELRIAAHFSQDPNLIEAFKKGQDVHAATAARVLKKKVEDISKSERAKAKMMNFGIIYGLSAFGLSQRTGMTRDAAAEFIESYFNAYSKLKEYIDSLVNKARKDGYVETLFGRRRYLPELSSQNWQVRSAAERAAVNHPFQGTNADIIKKAMIKMHADISEVADTLILQVHDELIFEVANKDAERLARAVKKIMETVTKLRVPVVAEIKSGINWGQLESN